MKKILYLMMATFVAVSMAACGGSDGTDPEPEPEPEPVNYGNSTQYATKTISIPAANFPAVDVVSAAETFTIESGKYLVEKNGVEMTVTNQFASGILLNEGDELTISQNGVELAFFTPLSDGAGVKIKIEGLGNTSSLTTPAGVGRGLYTLRLPDFHMSSTGVHKPAFVYTGPTPLDGNGTRPDPTAANTQDANQLTEFVLEGGKDYILRHVNLESSGDTRWIWDAETIYAFNLNPSCYIMVCEYTAANEAAGNDATPLFTYRVRPNQAYAAMCIPLLKNPTFNFTEGNNKFRIQGMCALTSWFAFWGPGVDPDLFDYYSLGMDGVRATFQPFGVPPGIPVWAPNCKFKLYLTSTDPEVSFPTEDERATPAEAQAFCVNSAPGLDPGSKWVVLQVAEQSMSNVGTYSVVLKSKVAGSTTYVEQLLYNATDDLLEMGDLCLTFRSAAAL